MSQDMCSRRADEKRDEISHYGTVSRPLRQKMSSDIDELWQTFAWIN